MFLNRGCRALVRCCHRGVHLIGSSKTSKCVSYGLTTSIVPRPLWIRSCGTVTSTSKVETTGEKRTRQAKEHFDQGLRHHNGSDRCEKSPSLAFECFKKAADLGLVGAQTNVAVCYSHGLGVERDPEAAFIYYRLGAAQGDAVCHYSLGVLRSNMGEQEKAFENFSAAAEKGYPPGLYGLAEMYINGIGTERSLVQAVKYYRLGAEHKDANSIYKLGLCYYNGTGVVESYSEAFGLFLQAAEMKHTLAMCSLGSCYEDGLGVAKSPTLAFKYYKLSADAGYAIAQFNAQVCLAGGVGVAADAMEARRYCGLAADQGHVLAQYNMGLYLAGSEGSAGGGDAAAARRYMSLAAEQGLAQAQLAMGLLQSEGADSDSKAAFRWFEKAAEQGLAQAKLYLGHCYYKGTGVNLDLTLAEKYYNQAAVSGSGVGSGDGAHTAEQASLSLGLLFAAEGEAQDLPRAFECYRTAADAGLAEAQVNVGSCFAHGFGVPLDVLLAAKYYRLAAEQGHGAGQHLLGEAMLLGRGVARNETEGIALVRLAAEKGFAPACYLLGLTGATGSMQALGGSAETGSSFPPDPALAVKFLKRAADQNHAAACGLLALWYRDGIFGVTQDQQKAVLYFQRGAEAGDPMAQFNMGVGLVSGQFGAADTAGGSAWISRAAEQGLVDAQFYVGSCFLHGTGFMGTIGAPTTKDPRAAVKYFRRAAEQKHPISMYNLGICLIKGVGVASDYIEAVHFLKLSAEQKCPQAAHELGILYSNGFGVSKDQHEGIKYFTIAADLNFANSQFVLGVSYIMGTGVSKDLAKGKDLIQKAADQGQSDALNAIKLL